MKARRLILVALATAAAVVLSGCGVSGGVAARVGGATITADDVNFLADMQCTLLDTAAKNPLQSGSVPTQPRREVVASMVNALIDSTLNEQLAEKEHADYDRTTYRQAMDRFESAVAVVPAADQARFRDLVGQLYRGQLQLISLAQASLAAQGVLQPTSDQLNQAAAALQEQYRSTIEVSVNPRYGPNEQGIAGRVSPSLSVAVSDFAKQASSAQPSASWVSGLPADMRCGS